MKIKTLLLFHALTFSGLAAELPPPVLPEGVGVNIHFTRGHERDLDLIAAAGFKFIRMDFGWAGIERIKGEYVLVSFRFSESDSVGQILSALINLLSTSRVDSSLGCELMSRPETNGFRQTCTYCLQRSLAGTDAESAGEAPTGTRVGACAPNDLCYNT